MSYMLALKSRIFLVYDWQVTAGNRFLERKGNPIIHYSAQVHKETRLFYARPYSEHTPIIFEIAGNVAYSMVTNLHCTTCLLS